MKKKNKTLYIYLYYAVLLLILASRGAEASEPPMVLRLAFMAAVIAPTIAYNEFCYPAILTMFFAITRDGFSYSYMPYNLSIYVIITIAITVFFRNRKDVGGNYVPTYLILMTLYLFLIDLVFSMGQHGSAVFNNTALSLISIICFLLIIGKDKEVALQQFPLCFAVTTIVLCYAFFTGREHFTVDYFNTEYERTGWTDPNFFGMLLGMGTVSAFIKLFSQEWKMLSNVDKGIYLSAIVLSMPVLLLNASRGAVLSVTVAFTILLVASKVRSSYKILFVILAVVGLFYLYSNNYFDLLLFRIENDDGTGSDRTVIWADKLNAFFNGNFIQMIVGYGHTGGSNITGTLVGFHNDYVGFLVDYGFIGLAMLLYWLYYPVSIARNAARVNVVVLIVYLAMCFVTLEPLLTGILPYFVFYIFALLTAMNSREYPYLTFNG